MRDDDGYGLYVVQRGAKRNCRKKRVGRGS